MAKFEKTKKIVRSKPAVYLVRHGATKLNNGDKSIDRIRGWLDVPLNEEGIKDAEKAAKKLKNKPIDIIYSSDLIRARTTAEIINEYHDVSIIDMTELRPWNLGDFNGQVTDKVIDQINKLIINEDEKAPNGESFKQFRIRYLSKLNSIINLALQKNEQVVVATHLRNLKLADGWFKAGFPKDYKVDTDVVTHDEFPTGEIMEVPLNKYKKR